MGLIKSSDQSMINIRLQQIIEEATIPIGPVVTQVTNYFCYDDATHATGTAHHHDSDGFDPPSISSLCPEFGGGVM